MKTIKLLSLLFLVFAQYAAFSQVEKYMAAFTYQICKATTWPAQSDNFVIGVIGQSDIIPFFEKMSEEKKIGAQSIKVVASNNVDEVSDCQVVFISKEKTAQLDHISKALANKPILIITESSDILVKGANLNFTVVDNKIRYSLNKTDLTSRNLIVHSTIERMALKVY
ncbi:MAG: YfiR family protein [Prolixibacteraceae bacterium]